MNYSKYIDPNYKGPLRLETFFQKLKSEGAASRIFSKFNKRYFILDLNNYCFSYKDKPNSSSITTYSLSELLNIDPNPRIIEICDWKFAFVVQISQKTYYLYADSVSAHREWCFALKACLKPLIHQMNTEAPKPSQPIPQPVYSSKNNPLNTVDELRDTETEAKNTSNEDRSYKESLPAQTEQKLIQKNEYFRKSSFESGQDFTEKNQEIPNPVSHQIEKSKFNLPVERSKSNYNRPEDYLKFQVIKNNLDADPLPKNKTDEEEDEISVISGPVSSKKTDEIEQATPLFFPKGRQVSNQFARPTPKKPEDKKNSELNSNIFVKPVQEKIDLKPGGILDMMNDFDELGLETVKIRSIKEVKKGLNENKKEDLKKTLTSNPVKTEEKSKFNAGEKKVPKENEFFSAEPEKKKLGKISVKPGFGKIKIGYSEKPAFMPDEDIQKSAKKQTEIRGSSVKERPKFVSKNVPQGKDCDWESWDD